MVTFEQIKNRELPVAVVGLGYVGLPLAVALSREFDVVGFDVSSRRIRELQEGVDSTGEVDSERLRQAVLTLTDSPTDLRRAGVVIVAVPTPIDQHRRPDLAYVSGASTLVGENMLPGCMVVFESTVYPGLTEEVCVPILEQRSGLVCGRDFRVGYSPERINPGDKEHTLETIVKIVAGQDEDGTELLARLYGSVVTAGVHRASSIKVAEAAKVIENTQRDLNIALMNELALIFQRLGIDTQEVLEAAGTKWNFLRFTPGLVGGHCIGVDPYYLTFKAEALGFHPQVILAGRRINDFMGKHVAETAIKMMNNNGCRIRGARVGVLGLTFKENVPDLRNTRVIDVIEELREYKVEVLVHDPAADPEEALHEYGLRLAPLEEFRDLSAVILAVPHEAYKRLPLTELRAWFGTTNGERPILLDVKAALDPATVRAAGMEYWRL